MADTILQNFNFECPECGLACNAKKIRSEEGEIKFQTREFTGGLRIDLTHKEPHCGKFRNDTPGEFMRAATEKRNAVAS